ncbi:MAG: hypothetical protein WC627_00970 [Legionella sp.]|jgi:hypothetical protein
MKKIIILLLILINFSVNATTISRLPNGFTYCVSEFGGNFKIDWKHNIITLTLAGSDKYQIVHEVKDNLNNGLILTARMHLNGNDYLEFKIFSYPSGNYFRALDSSTKEYPYKPARLTCWNET